MKILIFSMLVLGSLSAFGEPQIGDYQEWSSITTKYPAGMVERDEIIGRFTDGYRLDHYILSFTYKTSDGKIISTEVTKDYLVNNYKDLRERGTELVNNCNVGTNKIEVLQIAGNQIKTCRVTFSDGVTRWYTPEILFGQAKGTAPGEGSIITAFHFTP